MGMSDILHSSPSVQPRLVGVITGSRYLACFTIKALTSRMYLAVALFFITNLFSLYRLSMFPSPVPSTQYPVPSTQYPVPSTQYPVPSTQYPVPSTVSTYHADWWPKRLGGKTSYALSWGLTLLIGLTAHHLDLFKMRERWQSRNGADEVDWERKSKYPTGTISRPRICVG
jgi:hypothetical protein